MKIVQVPHRYRPSIGGIENYVHRLTESLEDSGHTVSVVTTDDGFDDGNFPESRSEAQYCRTTASILRNPVSVELYRTLRRTDADVYHVHSPFFLTTVEAVHAIPDDAKVVMTVHGFPPRFSLVERLRNTAYTPVVNHVLRKVDETVVLGPSERERLRREYITDSVPISVIPNGIHPDEYDVSPRAIDRFQKEYRINPETPTLLFVGRLIDWKNPGVLVDAVVEGLPDYDLDVLLIGDGEPSIRSDLRRRADDRFSFHSGIPFDDLKAAYHASDVYVHLSESEGLSTVILEAMNARLPVVATPAGALKDVLIDGTTGAVLEMPPSTSDVSRALVEYLDDERRREEVGEYNRRYVRTQFDWEDVAAGIEALYRRVVDGEAKNSTDGEYREVPDFFSKIQ